jgi:hypothetical protein
MTGVVVPLGRSGAGSASARAVARSRHPTARAWVPDRGRLLERLAERAHARGAPWPRVAAAVLLLRGVAGDDRPAFARRVGMSEAVLERLERGLSPASAVPDRLRAVPDLVDWSWVEAPVPR